MVVWARPSGVSYCLLRVVVSSPAGAAVLAVDMMAVWVGWVAVEMVFRGVCVVLFVLWFGAE